MPKQQEQRKLHHTMAKSDHDQVQKQQQQRSNDNSQNKKTASSMAKKFKGVRMRTWGSWVSEIRAPNQKTRIWLGSYSTAEAAARAYDAALLCLKGSASAAPNLNFPISSYPNHLHNTFTTPPMSPKSIQRLAAAAAANQPIHHHNPPPPPSSADSYNHFVPSPYSTSTSSNYSASLSSSSQVSSPTSVQLYDDVSLPLHINDISPTLFATVDESTTWQGLDQFVDDDQQQHYQHQDHEQLFTFDDSSLVSFDAPPPAPMFDDFYYEGDIRLWSFAE